MAPPKIERDQAKITVLIKGNVYEGWLESTVERNLETLTGTFSIPISLDPDNPPSIQRGDEVQVRIGDVPVITGYVLAAAPFYRRNDCGMRIIGRDRAGDLVRSSALHAGGQWRNATLDRIVKDLVQPFGIPVVVEAPVGAPLNDFKVSVGETVLEAISRAARMRGVLVTRNDLGSVVLTKAGKDRFDAAIVRGANVITMEDIGSDEQVHSEYIAYAQCNIVTDFDAARHIEARAKNADMPRYSPLIIYADGNTTQAELQALVDHTMRVRRGHSMGFRYVVEGWTYKGKPWPLNQRVAVFDAVAGLDGAEWLICGVKQMCDLREGDVTELILRPIEAYDTVPLKTKVVRHRRGGQKLRDSKHLGGPR